MRPVNALIAALIYLIFPSILQVYGFNLEPRIPIVKVGPRTSHFGYSVAQHKTISSRQGFNNEYKSWILVGAPKGENLQPGTNRSGALYKCPMTSWQDDCQQVQTDGLKNANGLYKGSPDGTLLGPAEDEIKDDQWMGVTLKSQGVGGDILVCGHRYQHKGIGEQNFRWGYGLCYRLKNNFEYEDIYQPCMGKPVDLEHEQFGYCQAGTSGLLLEDEVVLGIPGTYTWRGTVHTRNISEDYLFRDKTHYFGVYTDDDSPVDKYSYLGYSVAAGRFFGNKLSYVAGAPRSRGTGQVIFFSRDRIGNPIMNFDLILNGEMFASSFGFEVVVMDVNNDKRDDLVVSAPFYFTKQSSGAVYIYMNDGTGLSNETPFSRLEGPAGESRFGFSMTSLGDLNLDGYDDLAVGAPYENRGAIYIYLGSRDGIIKKPSQVIRAEDLPGLPADAFGYALSGGMDLDNNNYNDLLTSSFCSDRVVLLRARPIIDIQTKVDSEYLRNINPTKPGCPEDPTSRETCFSFNACFKMENEAGTPTYLSLQYNISERFYNDQPTNRIRFRQSPPDMQSTIQQIIELKPQIMGRFQCTREVVYLKQEQRDLLRPVRFKLSYKIHQRIPKPVEEGEPLPDINDYPILNQKEAVRYFEANFAKDCGADEICDSDLKVSGELDLEKHSRDKYYVFELGKRQFFTLSVVVSNNGEPAYLPNLYVSHDEAIDMSLRESETGSYQCFPVQTGLLHCNLENPLVNETQPIKLVFKPSGLPFKSKYIDLTAWVNSTSEELYVNDNEVKFILEVKRRAEISITGSGEPEQVFYSGEVVGESSVDKMEQVGTQVIHKYLVDNRGPWKVDELKVLIHWPYQVENNKKEGKWLLYMTDIPLVDGDGECDVNPEYINTLGLTRKVFVENEIDISYTGEQIGLRPSVQSRPGANPTMTVTTSQNKTVFKQTISSSANRSITDGSTFSTRERERSSNYNSGGGGSDTRFRSSSGGSSSNTFGSSSSFDRNSNFDRPHERNRDYGDRFGSSGSSYGGNRQETSYVKRVYGSGYDVEGGGDLSAVVDIKTVKDGEETFINGYNDAGSLVWSSRSPNDVATSSKTFVSYKSGNNIDDNSIYSEAERRNERLLTENMNNIADFRIMHEGEEAWVNGYDKWGNLIWSSRSELSNSAAGGHSDGDYVVRKKYSKVERTGGSDLGGTETRREWSTLRKDNQGTEHRQSGSSFTDRHGTKKSWGSPEPDDIWNGNQRSTFWDDGDVESSRRTFRVQNEYSRDSTRLPQSDSPRLHGFNYSRAIVDPESGDVRVTSQRVFSRRGNDRWKSVDSPYESSWSRDSSTSREGHRRTKREREFVVKSEAITDVKTGKTVQVVTFTCDGRVPTAKCFTFQCTIRNLAADQSARIRIPSRLWNATLVEDYPLVSFVTIKSKGELILPDEIRSDQDTSDDVAYAETLAYSNLLEQLPTGSVPWWVILISVLAGLLLLVVIAYALWKIGFFKRRRPDPTYSGNINRRHTNGYN